MSYAVRTKIIHQLLRVSTEYIKKLATNYITATTKVACTSKRLSVLKIKWKTCYGPLVCCKAGWVMVIVSQPLLRTSYSWT